MLLAKLKDKVNNIDSYIYLEYRNKKLVYHGVKISCKKIENISEHIFYNIYNMIKVNDDCKYIEDYQDYKVYYDNKNALKHYLKDGKEDFLLFFLKNGVCVDLAKKRDDINSRKRKEFFKFNIQGIMLTCQALFLANIIQAIAPAAYNYLIPEIQYEVTKLTGNELENITLKEAIDMITDSPYLTGDQKQLLCNAQLLSDVLPYYEDSVVQYEIKYNLTDINIEYYKSDDGSAGKYGYGNTLYVSEDYKDDSNKYKNDIVEHEYVHLLQDDTPLHYIKEAGAELVASEYYHRDAWAYKESVYNLKLLIETTGPKAIWKTMFKRDSTELNDIIYNSLSKEDADKLIKELEISPFHGTSNHNMITELIEKLYKNIYGIEMRDDRSIYDYDGNYIEKTYFNQDLATVNYVIYTADEAVNYHLAQYQQRYRYKKEINLDEYNKFLSKYGGYNYHDDDKYMIVEMNIKNNDFNYEDKQYTYTYYYDTPIKNDVKAKGMILEQTYKSLKSNNYDCTVLGGDTPTIMRRITSIQDRFPDQMIRDEQLFYPIKIYTLDKNTASVVSGVDCYITDNNGKIFSYFVTTNNGSTISLPVGEYAVCQYILDDITGKFTMSEEKVKFYVSGSQQQDVLLFVDSEEYLPTPTKIR